MKKKTPNIPPTDLPVCRTCSGACMYKAVGLDENGKATVFCTKDVRPK